MKPTVLHSQVNETDENRYEADVSDLGWTTWPQSILLELPGGRTVKAARGQQTCDEYVKYYAPGASIVLTAWNE